MSKNPVQNFLRLLILLFLGGIIGFYLGTNQIDFKWKNYKPTLNIQSKTPPKDVNVDLFLFWDVWERVSKNYVEKKALDPQKMIYGAIAGMVQALGDPYTVFLPPEQNTQVKQELAGQFEGIGAQLGIKDKKIVVIAPLPGSPAEKAGIKSGDAILKVDNAETANWTLPEAVAKIRGPKGTTVKLAILREREEKAREIAVVRETIRIKSVEGKIKDQVAYLKLSQFGDETNNEWLITVNSIASSIKEKPVRGLILDLRNNSGGYLNGAVFIASEFLRSGTVVIQERGEGQRQSFPVNRKGLLTDLPMVVLINKGSASASEIVAAALRDNKGAKLIGETSFGKGTIQEAQDLGGGAGLHITVAKWLTPKGEWVNGKGLTPDIEVKMPEDLKLGEDPQLEKAMEILKR